MALAAGVKLETLDVIAGLMPLDARSKDDACLEECGREMIRDHRISDATYADASQRVGTPCLMDLTALTVYYGIPACSPRRQPLNSLRPAVTCKALV